MINLLLIVVFLTLAIFAWRGRPVHDLGARWQAPIFLFLAVAAFASMSFYIVPQDMTGHLKRVYLADSLPDGRIIALQGQKGPQAEILPPGFHFRPFIRLLYDIEDLPILDVADNRMAILRAKDGVPLKAGQFIARAWGEARIEEMLNAETFLNEGGQRGVQETVLPPGQYRFNRYLFDAAIANGLDVPAGHVAVVKSNVQNQDDCPADLPAGVTDKQLATPIVPVGCIGVWDKPLMPGRYYLNPRAYTATLLPTTVQTWTYKGNYNTRRISLTLDDKGRISQEAVPVVVEQPDDAADGAIIVTVEGWRVPIELRILVQVNPVDAPRVVASVGELGQVEDKIGTPGIRSVVRNVSGAKGRKVLDLINQRSEIERLSEEALGPELYKAGVTLKEIRMGDPIIPPELLVARQREQLASQLEATYRQEKQSQETRIETEKARAQADEQARLVKADINVQVAERTKEQLHLEGQGEKLRLQEIAEGQKAQANVLGEENAMQLAMTKLVVEAALENPAIVKFPMVYSQGNGGSLDSAAAILGISNLNRLANPQQTTTP